MKNWILGLPIVFVSIFFMGCNKDKKDSNQDLILGTWISSDKTDTLDFVDNSNFYKSNSDMQYDHYDYQLFADSIQIGYKGNLYILVIPTMHKYTLDNETLTIELNNKQCFGFDLIKSTYKRQN